MVNSRLINNAYVFLIITTLFSKVLYIAGQQRTADKTGHGNWYDKSKWSSSTKHQNSRISGVEGSGSEIDDMDDRASGFGPDDEDAQFGSGDDDEPIEGSGGSHEKYDEQFTYSSTMATWTPATSTRPTMGTTTTTTTTSNINIMVATKRKTQTMPTVEYRVPSTTPRIRLEVETRAPHIVPLDRTPATVATVGVGQTTVRHHASSTPMSDIYDTNTKRNDRNGFEWILSPGVLTAVIGGAVVGLLAAILLVMFIVYRMRKKDEGSYALEEPKSPPTYSYAYHKAPTREFYA